MVTKIKTKELRLADDTELRTQKILIGGKWLQTPIKCLNPNVLYANKEFPKSDGIIELYKKFDSEKLKKFEEDSVYSSKISRQLSNLKVRGGEGNPSFTMISFDSEKYPMENEIKRMCRLSHAFSDFTPIPSIAKIVRNLKITQIKNLRDYLDKCIENIQIRNKKPLMGYVPITCNVLIVEDILKNYLKKGINCFYFDFDGTVITSSIPQIQAAKDILSDYGHEENHFIHYINLKYGTNAINNTNIVSAKDIIGYCWGLDCFGEGHIAPRRGKKYYEWLKKKKNVLENKIRLFDKKNYGYYKLIGRNTKDILEVYPKDSIIGLNEVDISKKTVIERVSKIVNLQQQIIETKNISLHVKEQTKDTIKYFEEKKYLDKEIIKKMKK